MKRRQQRKLPNPQRKMMKMTMMTMKKKQSPMSTKTCNLERNKIFIVLVKAVLITL